jgi:hypothetical protein
VKVIPPAGRTPRLPEQGNPSQNSGFTLPSMPQRNDDGTYSKT